MDVFMGEWQRCLSAAASHEAVTGNNAAIYDLLKDVGKSEDEIVTSTLEHFSHMVNDTITPPTNLVDVQDLLKKSMKEHHRLCMCGKCMGNRRLNNKKSREKKRDILHEPF